MELIKSKKNTICHIVIFTEFIFIEFPHIFLVGPIGIFGNSGIMVKIINAYGKIIKIVPIDPNVLIETFMQRIGNCDIPCAQLARIYADNWGVVLLVCVPILTHSYINEKIKKTDTLRKALSLFGFLTFYMLVVILFLSVIPLICAVKLNILYDGGSAMEIFKYIGLWLTPSVMVLTGLQILLAFAVKEPIGQIIFYVLIIAPSLPPDVSSYPFYKFVIRFNGKSEAFYYAMRWRMLLNRIWILVTVAIIFLVFFLILKRRRKGYNKPKRKTKDAKRHLEGNHGSGKNRHIHCRYAKKAGNVTKAVG